MKRTIRLLKNNLLSIKTEIRIDNALLKELEPGCLSMKWARLRIKDNTKLYDEFKQDLESIVQYENKNQG